MGLFGKKYDEDGYDKDGYDKDGFKRDEEMDSMDDLSKYRKYDKDGYDVLGFDKEGIHKVTGTKFDEDGYDRDGWNISGIDRNGTDRSYYEKKRLDVKEKEEEERRWLEEWESNAKKFAYYQEEEKWEDAIKCANILLEQTPDREDIMGEKAYCYYELGLKEEALKIYQKCKTDKKALTAKSILLEEMGMTEDDSRNYADQKGFNE
jgi:tetratricopeptide (TPR) repeat protein